MPLSNPPGPRILVVDDDDDFRMLVAEVLHQGGYDVVLARDGEEAVQRLCERPAPSLILLDLVMPGMDGIEFRRLQQQYLRWAVIPVVILSSHAGPGQATQLGVSAVVSKPVAPDVLLTVIRQYIRAPAAGS